MLNQSDALTVKNTEIISALKTAFPNVLAIYAFGSRMKGKPTAILI
jgi:predicted nucleotidyltransferase